MKKYIGKIIVTLVTLIVVILIIIINIPKKEKRIITKPISVTDRFSIESSPDKLLYQLTLLSMTDDVRCITNLSKEDLLKLKDNIIEITKE